MSKRALSLLAGLGCCLVTGLLTESLPAALAQEAKDPEWKHGLVLRARKADEPEFEKEKTTRYGAEIFVDKNAGNALYISYPGALAAAPGTSLLGGSDSKSPKWLHSMNLKCRKAGQTEWANAPKFGIEVFKDENSNNLIYLSQTGDIAVVKAPGPVAPADKVKDPAWLHSMDLKCRRGGEVDWGAAPKFGIEVYRDEHAGTLIYVTETGALAVAPPGNPASGSRDPKWLHGLEFKVRKAGQENFDPKTPNFGAEIYRDENAGNLVFITEKGFVAVSNAAGGGGTDTKAPKWLAGMEPKVRKFDEEKFGKDTKRFGVEIFNDPNTNHTVYISETASLAVVPVK